MDAIGEDIYGFVFALVTGVVMGVFVGLALARYLDATGVW